MYGDLLIRVKRGRKRRRMAQGDGQEAALTALAILLIASAVGVLHGARGTAVRCKDVSGSDGLPHNGRRAGSRKLMAPRSQKCELSRDVDGLMDRPVHRTLRLEGLVSTLCGCDFV